MTLDELLFATRSQLGDSSGADLFFSTEEIITWLNEAAVDAALRLRLLDDPDDVPESMKELEDSPALPEAYHSLLPIFAASRGLTKEGDHHSASLRMREYLSLIRDARAQAVLRCPDPLEIGDVP